MWTRDLLTTILTTGASSESCIIWWRDHEAKSHTPCINARDLRTTQRWNTQKRSNGSDVTSRAPRTKVLSYVLIIPSHSKFLWTQTLPEIGIRTKLVQTDQLHDRDMDTTYATVVYPLHGSQHCNKRSHYPVRNQKLQGYLMHYEKQYP